MNIPPPSADAPAELSSAPEPSSRSTIQLAPDTPMVGEPRRRWSDRIAAFWYRAEEVLSVVYKWVFLIKDHNAVVIGTPPEPAADIGERRVDVLLALHAVVRDSIQRWEDRIFQVFLISSGVTLSGAAFYLENSEDLGRDRALFASAVVAFGAAGAVYLYQAARAHAKNGTWLVQLEAALGLCAHGTYIKDARLAGYSGRWVPDWRTPILLMVHIGIVIFSRYVILHH